jgi:hypothetical protein
VNGVAAIFFSALGRHANAALVGIGSLTFSLYLLLSRLGMTVTPANIKTTLQNFLALIAALFLLLLFAAMIIKAAESNKRGLRFSLLIIAMGAVLFRAALLEQTPWLSNDIYRYLWDARLVEAGVNPYSFPPAADELANFRDSAIYSKMDHKNVHSVYSPFLQLLFWTGREISQIFGFKPFIALKLIFALIDFCLVLLLFRFLRQINLDPRWAILYAWHPLPIIEIAGSGHTDGVGALAFVLATVFLWNRKYFWAAVILALSFMVKFFTVIFLPLFFVIIWKSAGWKKAWLSAAIFIFIVAAGYAPFATAGEKLLSGLKLYSAKWRFNDGFFSFVFSGIHRLLTDDLVIYLMIPPNWEINEVTLTTRRIDLALIISKIFAGGIFFFIYLRLLWRVLKSKAANNLHANWMAPAIVILAAFFLLSPTLQPWYWLWILPLLSFGASGEEFKICRSMLIPLWLLSATVFLSYWILQNYMQLGIWKESGWVKWVEYGGPFLVWLGIFYKTRRVERRS